MSSPGEVAKEHSSEPAPKITMPASSVFFRPMRSPSSPAVNSSPAKTRVYELTAHSSWLWLAPMPTGAGVAMVFIATFRIELSSTTTSRLNSRKARMAQRRRWIGSGTRGAAGAAGTVVVMGTSLARFTIRARLVS